MKRELTLYNSLSRQKEVFKPLQAGYIGMYVCGPTVYNDVHLGNCRTFVSFDIIYRYLRYLGYKVRYVRNITDVGHLLDDGEDRMSKGARLEQLEPMEVAQKYSNSFQAMMRIFNTLEPSIEPRASGHIIEQIEMVQAIIDHGFAYEVNGSVYFDTQKFQEEKGSYGDLSGRKMDELLAESRELKNQGEKRAPSDFAIWMNAAPEHIMRWHSPWGEGFPGWHLECSAMSTRYLGAEFDIHGGGNDLKFPHHENEVAQNVASCNHSGARYWLHTNMLLLNGRKMSKSDGNTVSPQQLFTGDSEHLSKGYSPMVVRFFMLQAHYRSPLDLTDDALLAAEKGYHRLMDAYATLQQLEAKGKGGELDEELKQLVEAAFQEMDDDFNTPKALARLFELVPKINGLKGGQLDISTVSAQTIQHLQTAITSLIEDVLGLLPESATQDNGADSLLDGVMHLLLDLRQEARSNKDWATSDKIRDGLQEIGIQVKDGKEGASWSKS